MPTDLDFSIPTLGPPTHKSPLALSTVPDDCIADYTPDDSRLPHDPISAPTGAAFELAGPRERNYFKGPESSRWHCHVRWSLPRHEQCGEKSRQRIVATIQCATDFRLPLRLSRNDQGQSGIPRFT